MRSAWWLLVQVVVVVFRFAKESVERVQLLNELKEEK